MTFGIDLCYIVTPLLKQREIMERLIHHWQHGYGAKYNPLRGMALEKIRFARDMEEVLLEISKDKRPIIIGTSSRERKERSIGYMEVREMIEKGQDPCLLLFGTGWGLTDETVGTCDGMLYPIKGTKIEYNHLSVRVAVGIILDRIFGDRR